jgi:putative hydrolase of the HAD superfamily
MRLRAVLFDLDGTLLDRRATFRRHLELQLQRHGPAFPPGTASRYVARLLELDENGTLDRDVFHQRAEAEFGLTPGASLILKADFDEHFPEECVPFPDLFETLTALQGRGFKLGVITNGRELIQGRKIDRLGLRPFLDCALISESVGVRKPDPRIFARALATLGIAASEAAFVGDNPEPDVRGARRSGLHAIWRRDTFWDEPAEADWVIDDLSELLPIVFGEEADQFGKSGTA